MGLRWDIFYVMMFPFVILRRTFRLVLISKVRVPKRRAGGFAFSSVVVSSARSVVTLCWSQQFWGSAEPECPDCRAAERPGLHITAGYRAKGQRWEKQQHKTVI